MIRKIITVLSAAAISLCVGATAASAYGTAAAGDEVSVSLGMNHTLFIKDDMTLWRFGSNIHRTRALIGYRTEGMASDDAVSAAAGDDFSAYITSSGELMMWGANEYGELGNGTYTAVKSPEKIMESVTAVSCGSAHTAVITADGTLYTFGSNKYGQLGAGLDGSSAVPVEVMTDVKAVSAGGIWTAAVKTDGTLWVWGGKDMSEPHWVADGVKTVCAGYAHVVFIKEDATVWAFGDNSYHQIGDGSTDYREEPVKVLSEATDVAAGAYHTVAIQGNGTVYTWGSNSNGQLATGTHEDKKLPYKLGGRYTGIAAGGYHTGVLKKDGTLWLTGLNESYQLGDGTQYERTVFKKSAEEVLNTRWEKLKSFDKRIVRIVLAVLIPAFLMASGVYAGKKYSRRRNERLGNNIEEQENDNE